MSRRSKPERRIPAADPIYNSVDVSKFINRIMRRGKKSIAEKIFYSTITKIEERTGEKGLEIFQKGITNATPLLEVKARRIGGSTYQVPTLQSSVIFASRPDPPALLSDLYVPLAGTIGRNFQTPAVLSRSVIRMSVMILIMIFCV